MTEKSDPDVTLQFSERILSMRTSQLWVKSQPTSTKTGRKGQEKGK